jgi:hypothetical protein
MASIALQPHQERVVTERAELAEKINKLEKFLDGAVFVSLESEERVRLAKQFAIMKAYLEILDQRITAF